MLMRLTQQSQSDRLLRRSKLLKCNLELLTYIPTKRVKNSAGHFLGRVQTGSCLQSSPQLFLKVSAPIA